MRELVFPGVTPPSRRQGGFQPPLPGLPEIDFPGAWAGSPLAGKDAGVTPAFNLPTSSRQVKAHTEELLMLTRSDLPRSDYCLLAPFFLSWLLTPEFLSRPEYCHHISGQDILF